METEAITFIMNALQFGAAGLAAGPLNQKGIEVWVQLKEEVKRKFAGKAKAEMVLAEYEDDPDVWVEPLKKELIAANAHQDKVIMALAEKLKALEEAQQERSSGRNVINVNGGTVQGVLQENTGTNNMYFGVPPTKEGLGHRERA